MRRILCGVVSVIVVACTNTKFKTIPVETGNTVQEAPLGPPAIASEVASSSQCAAGGSVYTFFNDANSNGRFDDSENLLSRQVVCNGVQGANGQDGANGTNGADGVSMVFESIAASSGQCANGGNVLLIALDSDRSGSLSLSDDHYQSIVMCHGLNGAHGTDGTDGQDGADGVNASLGRFTPVDVIVACGNTSAYKEVLLILYSGDVLASFSNNTQGDMTRLAFLPDGTYMNTDSSGCIFSLATSSDGTQRSVSWNNTVQATWSVHQ